MSAIKDWREREHQAGRPSALSDFVAQLLCLSCSCTGQRVVKPKLWEVCQDCKAAAGSITRLNVMVRKAMLAIQSREL